MVAGGFVGLSLSNTFYDQEFPQNYISCCSCVVCLRVIVLMNCWRSKDLFFSIQFKGLSLGGHIYYGHAAAKVNFFSISIMLTHNCFKYVS